MVPFAVMMLLHKKSFELPETRARSPSFSSGMEESKKGSVLMMARFEDSTNKSVSRRSHVLAEDLIRTRLRFEFLSDLIASTLDNHH